ncbi:MAG: DUF2961 domain-containing protein [Mycobacteriaceae bacterium]|nr:DUF2961 domain-containing protein [Mycobacteriaceae bacterium]
MSCAPAQADPVAAAIWPNGPVGWDTYRRLDELPYLAPGSHTMQTSSVDKAGKNNDGAGGPLHAGGVGLVVAEDRGPGEIDSIWFTTRDYGAVRAMGNIRIELDGATVVDAPLQSLVDGKLGAPFVYPLVANAEQSPGGVYVKVPMPYRHDMRVSVAKELQYYHVDYRHFDTPDGVRTFDRADRAGDVLAMLRAAGARDPKPAAPGIATGRTVDLQPGESTTVATYLGPGSIRSLVLRGLDAAARAGLRLRVGFDGRTLVDSPVGEFFGAGVAARDVRALLFAADARSAGGSAVSWWPMPFAAGVHVDLVNTAAAPVRGIAAQVTIAPDVRWAAALATGRAGYFTARSHSGPTNPHRDWPIAHEFGPGKFVGLSQTFRGKRIDTGYMPKAPFFLEGNEHVHVDGSPAPQLNGTGTEDFYEAGWYFRKGTAYSAPLTGMPGVHAGPPCPDYCLSAYRLMLAESVNYRLALRFGMEHGPANDQPAEYSSTAFLYTSPLAVAAHLR